MNIVKILCPVDFSDSSNHALQYAIAFSKAHAASLHLLHVIQPLSYGVGVDGIDVSTSVDVLDTLQESCRDQLKRLGEMVATEEIDATTNIVIGTPFIEITRMAREEAMDMIVLGTHGRTGLAHMLIGSVAERVVRKAPCPVLTVKHPEHDFLE